MAQEKLPWDLMEDILYHLPLPSLIRFKTVCKKWNTLFNDKAFINNYMARVRPQFLLWSNFKICSIEINPDNDNDSKYEVHDLQFDDSYSDHMMATFRPCSGLFLCTLIRTSGKSMGAIWNPWLRQTRWIEGEGKSFWLKGIGYENHSSGNGYKIIGYSSCQRKLTDNMFTVYQRYVMYNFATGTWKYKNDIPEGNTMRIRDFFNNVSLNRNLYWPVNNPETNEYIIINFDFSKEILKLVCVLPWKFDNSTPILYVFRGDRLSVLKQLNETNKIEILVTENKIDGDEDDVVWMKFTTVLIPIGHGSDLIFFITNFYEKSLIVCCKDENNKACIYILRGDKFKKIEIDFDDNFEHCTYTPSLTPIS